MTEAQQEPASTPETDEIPKSSFGDKLRQYAFSEKSTASPKRPVTRSSSTLEHPPPRASPLIPSHRTPLKSTSSSTKRDPPPTHPSPSPPAKKRRKRPSSTYAPPSTYTTHPNHLTDALAPHLLILFIGCNPGLRTALTGHAYAHPSNLFYKLCHASGITPRLCSPTEDHTTLPHLYSLGHTNIVSRVTRDASELSKKEMDAGVAVLERKCREWRPEVVCLVGKGVWESVWRVRHGGRKEVGFRYGWRGEGENMGVIEGGWMGARVFVATTTSGLAAGMRPHEKLAVWKELGEWVVRRRGERGGKRVGDVEVEGLGAREVGDGESGGVDNDQGAGKVEMDEVAEEAIE